MILAWFSGRSFEIIFRLFRKNGIIIQYSGYLGLIRIISKSKIESPKINWVE